MGRRSDSSAGRLQVLLAVLLLTGCAAGPRLQLPAPPPLGEPASGRLPAPLSLTDSQGDELFPSLSPDGRRLAFAADRGGGMDIYVKRLPDGPARPLTGHVAYDSRPAWSPDGRRIAFVSAREDVKGDVWIVDYDPEAVSPATRQQRIGGREGGERSAVWLPDQSGLLIVSDRDAGRGEYGIWEFRFDGPVWRRLVDRGFDARLSPDGLLLAYTVMRGGTAVVVVRPRSGGSELTVSEPNAHAGFPAWSDDGLRLVWTGFTEDTNADGMLDTEDRGVLWEAEVGVDGIGGLRLSGVRQLTGCANGSYFAELRGDWLLFSRENEAGLDLAALPATGMAGRTAAAGELQRAADEAGNECDRLLLLGELARTDTGPQGRQALYDMALLHAAAGRRGRALGLLERLTGARCEGGVCLLAAIDLEAERAVEHNDPAGGIRLIDELIGRNPADRRAADHGRLRQAGLRLIDGQAEAAWGDYRSLGDDPSVAPGTAFEAALAESRTYARFEDARREATVLAGLYRRFGTVPGAGRDVLKRIGEVVERGFAPDKRIGFLRDLSDGMPDLPYLAARLRLLAAGLMAEAGDASGSIEMCESIISDFPAERPAAVAAGMKAAGLCLEGSRELALAGDSAGAAGLFSRAVDHYERVFKTAPDGSQEKVVARQRFVSLALELAARDEHGRDTTAALAEYRRIILALPDEVRAHRRIIELEAAAGRAEQTVREYERLLVGAPSSHIRHYLLGFAVAFCRPLADHIDRAEELIRRSLALNSRMPEAHLTLGWILEQRETLLGERGAGRLESAIDAYREAEELLPDDALPSSRAAVYLNLGNAFYLLGNQYGLAYRYYGLRRSTGEPFSGPLQESVFLFRFARAAYFNDHLAESLTLMKRARRLAERHGDSAFQLAVYGRLALFYQVSGQHDLSNEMVRRCIELRRQAGQAAELTPLYRNLGFNHFQKGEFDRASEYFRLATENLVLHGTRKVEKGSLVLLGRDGSLAPTGFDAGMEGELLAAYRSMIAEARGEAGTALAECRQRRDVLLARFADDRNPGWLVRLAVLESRIADLHERLGAPQAAAESLYESLRHATDYSLLTEREAFLHRMTAVAGLASLERSEVVRPVSGLPAGEIARSLAAEFETFLDEGGLGALDPYERPRVTRLYIDCLLLWAERVMTGLVRDPDNVAPTAPATALDLFETGLGELRPLARSIDGVRRRLTAGLLELDLPTQGRFESLAGRLERLLARGRGEAHPTGDGRPDAARFYRELAAGANPAAAETLAAMPAEELRVVFPAGRGGADLERLFGDAASAAVTAGNPAGALRLLDALVTLRQWLHLSCAPSRHAVKNSPADAWPVGRPVNLAAAGSSRYHLVWRPVGEERLIALTVEGETVKAASGLDPSEVLALLALPPAQEADPTVVSLVGRFDWDFVSACAARAALVPSLSWLGRARSRRAIPVGSGARLEIGVVPGAVRIAGPDPEGWLGGEAVSLARAATGWGKADGVCVAFERSGANGPADPGLDLLGVWLELSGVPFLLLDPVTDGSAGCRQEQMERLAGLGWNGRYLAAARSVLPNAIYVGYPGMDRAQRISFVRERLTEKVVGGVRASGAGQWTEARDAFSAAISLRGHLESAEPGDPLLAKVRIQDLYSQLVLALFNLKDYQTAIDYQRRLLTLAEANRDIGLKASALDTLATLHSRNTETDQAVEAKQKLTGLFESAGRNDLLAAQYEGLGVIYEGGFRNQEALDSYRRSLALNQTIGRQSAASAQASNCGRISLDRLNDPSTAHRYFEQALELAGNDTGMQVRARLGMTRARLAVGSYGEAVAEAERAGRLAATTGDRKLLAQVALELVKAYWHTGDYPSALEQQARAYDLAVAEDSLGHQLQAVTALGLIRLNTGELDRSEEALRLALKLARRLADDSEIAAAYNNIGRLYSERGDFSSALDNHERALRIDRRVGSRSGLTYDYVNMGGALFFLGQYTRAEEMLRQGERLSDSIGHHFNRVKALIGLGSLKLKTGAPSEAGALFESAAGIAGGFRLDDLEWRALAGAGLVAAGNGDHRLAAGLMERAAGIIERISGGVRLMPSRTDTISRREVFQVLADQLALMGETEAAFVAAMRGSAWEFLNSIGGMRLPDGHDRQLASDWERERQRLRRAVEAQLRASTAEERQTATDEERATRGAMEELLQTVRRDRPQLEPFLLPALVEPSELPAAALDDETVVMLYPGRERLHLWAWSRAGRLGYAFSEPEDLSGRIAEFRRRVTGAGALAGIENELYRLVFEPMELLLGGRSRISLIPAGELAQLPFDALRREDNADWVGQRYPIVWYPTVWHWARRGRTPSGPNPGSAAGFFNPGPGLNYIENEAEEFGRRLPRARLFVREQATVENLLAIAGRVDLLHIAAHTTLDNREPFETAIELSPAADLPGRLRLADVLGLRLNGAGVVLSGCSTGMGAVDAEGPTGALARAFLFAGARSVISSLWDLDDLSAALMAKHLQRGPFASDPAGALLLARRRLIERHPHPYFWAGHVVWGGL